jgi:alkanesulfonate monooxygenase SsuD/methylene tetrahydromethanopterin reductase-like flavin-dependent oxidoreductase (luciferase family)
MKVSLQLIPEQPAEQLLAAAQAADELGYYACYSADEIYHKDAWLLLTAVAGRTERIRLGPCVAPVYMRDPTYVAQLAATLDELSRGRAEVVLGIGNLAMLAQYGIEWRGSRPIARLREAYRVIRELLDEGSIDFQGEFFRYAAASGCPGSTRWRVNPGGSVRRVRTGLAGAGRGVELDARYAGGGLTRSWSRPAQLRHARSRSRKSPASRPSPPAAGRSTPSGTHSSSDPA